MLRQKLEAMLRSGSYTLVQETSKEYFSHKPVPSTEAAWVAIMACRAAGHAHAWGDAVMWADRGQAMAPDSAEASGWLHLLMGTASMYTGNVYLATRELEAFQRTAADCAPLQRLVPDSVLNEGFLRRFAGDLESEVRCFRHAHDLYRGQGRFRQMLQCLIEIAWSYLMHSRPDAAFDTLERIPAEMSLHGDQGQELDVQLEWAVYHRLKGDVNKSVQICHSIIDRPELIDRQRADLEWIMADNALSFGNIDEAKRLVDAAYERALLDWWPLQIQRIERLRESIHSKEGR